MRTYVLNGPGAIVKKITFKKGIDFCGKIIIIISVKGRMATTQRLQVLPYKV